MKPIGVKRRRLCVLGSTGSIGTQTLDVVRALDARFEFEVVGLAASGRRPDELARQIEEFRPGWVALARPDALQALQERLSPNALRATRFLVGDGALEQLVAESEPDLVVNGLVGAVGLRPTLAALERGIDVGLANKESLVVGGPLVRRALERGSAKLIPIDSEHSALFQLLQGRPSVEIARVVLTASGGALRDWPLERIPRARPEDVLRHPTWRMGPRITVDSATLVNKALEVIEAHWLFGLPYERLDVVIHPQSVVHGLVELTDGSWLAHLSEPDMRIPIQYALTYPERAARRLAPFDLTGTPIALEFRPLERARYPAFGLVVEAGRRGGTYPAVANAADEVAVERFLRREIAFGDIPRLIEAVLAAYETVAPASPPDRLVDLDLERVLEADRWARARARLWKPPS